MLVFPNRKVRPCMMSHQIMGDITKESPEKIWNGKRYQRFRKNILASKNKECLHCCEYDQMDLTDEKCFLRIGTKTPHSK